ncbi:MAG: hypothetical protein LBO08_01720 [Rickettsiales bacterium]|jgi:hypothetical protein|nr:hypothetical protein [Rickettsiales bacterium]
MKKLILILSIFVSACGGVSDRRITDNNVFDYIEARESTTNNDGAFFAPANKKDTAGCIPLEKDECYKKDIRLGERLNIKEYEVSFKGGYVESRDPQGKLLVAAAIVAAQDGFSFIAPLSNWLYSSQSTRPVAYTSGNYGLYTTSVYNETRYYESYSMKFIAYNNYDDIKNGILTDTWSENNGKGSLYSDLYNGEDYTLQLNAKFGYKEHQGGYSSLSHIANAWKTTYDVSQILQGENMQGKVGKYKISRYQPSNYTPVSEKYKQ